MDETTEDGKTNMDQKQLVERVEDLKHSNAALQAENDLFKQYISQLDLQAFETESQTERAPSPGRRSRASTPQPQPQLTWGQKCDVARSVYKQMKDDLKIAKDHSEKELDDYKATLEEADIHLAEVKKERSQFECDVVKVLQDRKNITMNAEKVIRYIEDKAKAKEKLIEKLLQKNAALLTDKKKIHIQLKHHEEIDLMALDFEQLKIKNIKYRKQLEELNVKRLNLKLLEVKTSQALNSNKEKLQIVTHESDVLNSDIALRKKLLVKLEEETKQAEKERNKAEALNRKLRGQLADCHVPDVLQYIKVKESHVQMEKSVRAWERKVEIAEMALKTHTKSWKKLQRAAGVGSGPARRVVGSDGF